MAGIDGLGGVLVYTAADRFEGMRRFYVDVLGLTPRSDRPGFVNFELGEQRLTVAVHSDVHSPTSDPLHVMVNLTTSDIHGVFGRVLDAGAVALRRPELESWGGWVATLTDPDGNIIQLLQLGNE